MSTDGGRERRGGGGGGRGRGTSRKRAHPCNVVVPVCVKLSATAHFPFSSSVKREKVPSKQLLQMHLVVPWFLPRATGVGRVSVCRRQRPATYNTHFFSRGYALGDKCNPLETNQGHKNEDKEEHIKQTRPRAEKPSCALYLGYLHEE